MKRLTAALFVTTSLALPAQAFDISSMNADEKAAFGVAVREYLMENPEVLVEAINVLEERRAETEAENDVALVAANRDALFDDGHSWVGGNPDGDLTMVEFIDYRCGVCRRFNDEVHELVESDGNIRLILKELPILGQDSEAASRFTVAVMQLAGDEAYMQAHEEMMTLRGNVSFEALQEVAGRIGLDGDAVINHMNTEDVSAVLRENRQLAERMAIQGTPTFVIGEHLLRGVPAAGLTETVGLIRAEMSEG